MFSINNTRSSFSPKFGSILPSMREPGFSVFWDFLIIRLASYSRVRCSRICWLPLSLRHTYSSLGKDSNSDRPDHGLTNLTAWLRDPDGLIVHKPIKYEQK